MIRRRSIFTALSSALLLALSLLTGISCSQGIPPEELKASVELVEVETHWEKKYYQPWPPKLTLVPAISFRIKNVGEKPLRYIYCNGIFKYEDQQENLGDNFVAGIRGEPVMPGETSDTITLQSFFGVEGQNVAHFLSNPAWKTATVKLFLKSGGSQHVPFGEYTVSKKINFKEPEPVKPPEEKKKDTTA